MVLQQLENLKCVVEDLEASQQLSDELEENHLANEKQLMQEIGKKFDFDLMNETIQETKGETKDC